jgi:hypothetical protein
MGFYFYGLPERLILHVVGGKHYRKQSIPCIHKHKASHNMWRQMRTFQQIRESGFLHHDEDAKYHHIVEPKLENLPTMWDDFYPQARRNRSWKQYRKTQYKVKQ